MTARSDNADMADVADGTDPADGTDAEQPARRSRWWNPSSRHTPGYR